MKFQTKLLTLMALCLCACSVLNAQTPTVTVKAGYPVGRPANNLAYSGSKYVLLTSYSYNQLFSSTMGTSWSSVTTTGLSATQLNCIAWGASLFVVVGNNGTVQTSPDGIAWTTRSSGTTQNLTKIYFVNSKFFAIGTGRTLLTSSDGMSWTAITFNVGTTNDFFMSLAYGNGWYVLSARSNASGGSQAITYRSTTGANNSWSYATDAPAWNGTNRIQFLNNKFWAFMIGNRMFTSPDGGTWTEITNSVVLTQPNSTTTSWNSSHQIFNGVWDGTKYSFYGSSQYYSGYGSTFTSPDGLNFTLLNKTAYIVPQESAILNGMYFVCGNEGIISSTDGLTYSHSGSSYRDMVKTANKYVAVGMISSDGQIYNSSDFNTWANRTPSNIRELYAIATDGSKILAGGYQGVYSSTNDGDSWTTAFSDVNTTFAAMAYGNSRFVAGGYDATTSFIKYSTDGGVSWTTANTLNYWYNKIKYVNGKFFALGTSNDDYTGRIMYSADGISWTDVTPTLAFGVYYFKDVAFDGTNYHILGVDANQSFFTVSTSTPATTSGYGNPAFCTNTPAGVTLGGTWDEGLLDYSSGKFTGAVIDIASGQDYIITSTNGSSWTALPQNTSSTVTASYPNGQTVQLLGRGNASLTVSYSGALPVSMLKFDGTLTGSSVKLAWITASEKNTKAFVVEHSADGLHWAAIGSVKASGNTSAQASYSLTHPNPVKGLNFYRLLQQDVDGTATYSRVITVNLADDRKAQWYPNPVMGEMVFHTSATRGIIRFYNSGGLLVKTAIISGEETKVNLSTLPSGIYMALIKQGSGEQKLSFIKN